MPLDRRARSWCGRDRARRARARRRLVAHHGMLVGRQRRDRRSAPPARARSRSFTDVTRSRAGARVVLRFLELGGRGDAAWRRASSAAAAGASSSRRAPRPRPARCAVSRHVRAQRSRPGCGRRRARPRPCRAPAGTARGSIVSSASPAATWLWSRTSTSTTRPGNLGRDLRRCRPSRRRSRCRRSGRPQPDSTATSASSRTTDQQQHARAIFGRGADHDAAPGRASAHGVDVRLEHACSWPFTRARRSGELLALARRQRASASSTVASAICPHRAWICVGLGGEVQTVDAAVGGVGPALQPAASSPCGRSCGRRWRGRSPACRPARSGWRRDGDAAG